MKQSLFSASIIAASAALAFTSCQNDDLVNPAGHSARISVRLGLGDDNTRTILSEENGDLKCTWEATDRVWVLNAEGRKLGELAITEGVGTDHALFDGELSGITDGDQKMTFVYFGRGVTPRPMQDTDGIYTYDFSTQEGTLASLSEQDMLYSTTDVSVDGASAYTDEMGLRRYISFAHFELVFPAGVTRGNEPVTISGPGLGNTLTLDVTKPDHSITEGEVTVGGSGNDFYVTILPNTIEPTFTVTIDGKTYSGSLTSRTWTASEFVRKSQGVGIPVNMTEGGGSASNEPADNPLTKWADSNLEYLGNETSGFVAPGAKGSLYQWGRNVGFKDYLDARGELREEIGDNEIVLYNWTYGMNGQDDAHTGTGMHVTWNNIINNSVYVQEAAYVYRTVEDLVDMKDWFVMNARLSGNSDDYWVFSGGGNDWYTRAQACGYSSESPCPAGWRLPTRAEWEEIMPSRTFDANRTLTSLVGTYVDIRTSITGKKFAIRWQVVGDGMKAEAVIVPDSYTTSDASKVDWSGKDVVTRTFPYTGKITAYYQQVGNYWYGFDKWATPVPMGTYSQNFQYYGDHNLFHIGITNDFSAYVGNYWCGDSDYAMKFFDNSRISVSSNSWFLMETAARHDAMAIRPVRK